MSLTMPFRWSYFVTIRQSWTTTGTPCLRGGKEQACGWLIDKFGLRWQIVPAAFDEMINDSDPVRSQRVTDALFSMVKIDIAALERAYNTP